MKSKKKKEMDPEKRKEIDNFVAEWMEGNKQNARFGRENNRCMIMINDNYPRERWNIQYLLEELLVAYLDSKDKEWLSIRAKE